jgi:hypothetical protein
MLELRWRRIYFLIKKLQASGRWGRQIKCLALKKPKRLQQTSSPTELLLSSHGVKKLNQCTWSENKVRELIDVKVLHTSLLKITVVAFKVLCLGSYALMPAPSPPFKTLLELVLWNGLQNCLRITLDVISVIKMPPFQYFLYLWEQKKSHWELDLVNREGVPAQLFVY